MFLELNMMNGISLSQWHIKHYFVPTALLLKKMDTFLPVSSP